MSVIRIRLLGDFQLASGDISRPEFAKALTPAHAQPAKSLELRAAEPEPLLAAPRQTQAGAPITGQDL